MYHNHIDKDYSHPWYTPDRLEREDEGAARLMHKAGILRFLFPFYGWAIYLYGMPDGSHFIPWASQRMWKESPNSEYTKCIISTVSCIAWAGMIYVACGQDLKTMAYYYGAPWIMLGWWLVAVTYLQHHNPETLVYDDDDWKFVDSAFETVDRTFGFGIDTLHHHITGTKCTNKFYTATINNYPSSPLTSDYCTTLLQHRRTRRSPPLLHQDPPLQPPHRDQGH
jgi:acyl-lipid omega-3 desaturase